MTCAHLDRKLLSLLVDLLNRHRAEDGPQVSLKRPKQTNKKTKTKTKQSIKKLQSKQTPNLATGYADETTNIASCCTWI
jgi:hypothetical protein